MRTCPFDDCGAAIPEERFACKKHWFRLTQAQRNLVWDAYREYQASVLDVAQKGRDQ